MASPKAQSITPLPEQVLTLGYRLYLEKGCPEGAESEIWQEAERMLKLQSSANGESAQGDSGVR